jgi:hypothetical protein
MKSSPTKHMTYFDLREALAGEGCAICRLVAAAVNRYLRALVYSHINDPGVRGKLRASRGFCRQHAWQVQRVGDPLAISILWRDLLSQSLEGNDSCRRRGRHRPRMCPACEAAVEAERRYLGTLLDHIEVGELRNEYAASRGLCLPHVRAALAQASPEAKRFLMASESDKLARLSAELAEIILNNDYRFREEPWGAERDAWIRATGKLVGEPPEP